MIESQLTLACGLGEAIFILFKDFIDLVSELAGFRPVFTSCHCLAGLCCLREIMPTFGAGDRTSSTIGKRVPFAPMMGPSRNLSDDFVPFDEGDIAIGFVTAKTGTFQWSAGFQKCCYAFEDETNAHLCYKEQGFLGHDNEMNAHLCYEE